LRLENPMKVKRIVATPPPRPPRRENPDRNNNRNARGPGGPDRNARPGASADRGAPKGGPAGSEYESNQRRRFHENGRYDAKGSEGKF
jgi:hypothetical protein